MESTTGLLEQATSKTGAKGPYLSLKISGKIYNYRGPNTDDLVRGVGRNIDFSFNSETYNHPERGETTSRWIVVFNLLGDASKLPAIPSVQAPLERYAKPVDDCALMLKCFHDAKEILEKADEELEREWAWSTEDLRSVAISLFIDRSKR